MPVGSTSENPLVDAALVTNCMPVPPEFSPLGAAMYDYGEPPEKGRWPFNVLARDAVLYSCGTIALPDVPVEHRHAREELQRCLQLSKELAALMQGVDLVRTTALSSPLDAFYMAANIDEPAVAAISAAEVSRAFRGTIYPRTAIRIEPLREGESW